MQRLGRLRERYYVCVHVAIQFTMWHHMPDTSVPIAKHTNDLEEIVAPQSALAHNTSVYTRMHSRSRLWWCDCQRREVEVQIPRSKH